MATTTKPEAAPPEEYSILNGTATLTVYPNGKSIMTNHGTPLQSMNPLPKGKLDKEGQKIHNENAKR